MGWSQEALPFILVLGHSWSNRGPGREERAGALGASGRNRAEVGLSVQELRRGGKGGRGFLGGDWGKVRCPVLELPGQAWVWGQGRPPPASRKAVMGRRGPSWEE